MKHFFIAILLLLVELTMLAQPAHRFSFQAIIRDNNEKLIVNQNMGIKISILIGSEQGEVAYCETQSITSNAYGIISLEIGNGNVISGNIAEINWSHNYYYIKTEVDPTIAEGSNYTISGITPITSVPFAIFSKNAEKLMETDPNFASWDKKTGIIITENQVTDLNKCISTEEDPLFRQWNKTTGITITKAQVKDLGEINGITTETDPNFSAWNKSTGITITKSQVSDFGNYIETETDPTFSTWDKSTGITITKSQVSDFGNYIESETDPTFSAWDKSTGITITKSQVSDFGNYIESETDPIFSASIANNISSSGSGAIITTDERAKLSGIENGAQKNMKPDWNATSGSTQVMNKPTTVSSFENDTHFISISEQPNAGDLLYYNGSEWSKLPKGVSGQLVAINAEGQIVWGNAPMVTTTPPINAVNQTAILTGKVNPNGLETTVIFEYGLTTEYGNTIPANLTPISGNSEIAVTASISGLTIGETYHYRVKSQNILSTITGHDVSFTETTLCIGDDYAGGKVAYIFEPGDHGYVDGETHGIIVSNSNITVPSHSLWGCSGTSIATSTAIGYGKENTLLITSSCPANSGGGQTIAAHACNNLVRDGYSDWYLPSLNELVQIYNNKSVLGSFSNEEYWSSSQVNSVHAYYKSFATGVSGTGGKGILLKVRPIRYF